MLETLDYFHPHTLDDGSLLALVIAEELMVEQLVNPWGFTFWDAFTVRVTLPSGYGRIITRSVTRQWMRGILKTLCLLEILHCKHGVYSFTQESWNSVLLTSCYKAKLAEMPCSSVLN